MTKTELETLISGQDWDAIWTEVNRIQGQLSEYESKIPPSIRRMLLILGISAVIKKPWLAGLAVAQYVLFRPKST